MEKVLAILILIIGIWFVGGHLLQGEWVAPTAISPGSWVTDFDRTGLAMASASPSTGYGWFHFDFWNNPPSEGRVNTRNDWRLRY